MPKTRFQRVREGELPVLKDSTKILLLRLLTLLCGALFVALHGSTRRLAMAFLFIAAHLLWLTRRYVARTKLGPKGEEPDDSCPLILYLRSFADEDSPVLPNWFIPEMEEEKLGRVFGKVGHFVALGNPGETLPTLGARRMYVEEDWQKSVTGLMTRARLVVVRTGATEGIMWEVGQATELLRPEQLLLVVPQGRESYDDFRRKARPLFRRPLPEYPAWTLSRTDLKGVIWFEADWTPRFVTLKWMFLRGRALDGLPHSLQAALQPVYARLGIEWRPPSINWLRLLVLGLLALLLLRAGSGRGRQAPVFIQPSRTLSCAAVGLGSGMIR